MINTCKNWKSLVAENGQILIDSTDILYMYDQDEDGVSSGSCNRLLRRIRLLFALQRRIWNLPMKWLYLDFDTLENAAIANGFKNSKIEQLEDSYLAQITLK